MMSSLPSLSQSMKPTPPLIDSTMYLFSGVERCGTVRPACCVMSSKRGTGGGEGAWARQGMVRSVTTIAVQSLPMGFVYSSRVFMRPRRVLSSLMLVCLAWAAPVFAQKSAEKSPAPPNFQLIDVTAKSGIHFEHVVSPEKK